MIYGSRYGRVFPFFLKERKTKKFKRKILNKKNEKTIKNIRKNLFKGIFFLILSLGWHLCQMDIGKSKASAINHDLISFILLAPYIS